MRVRRIEVLVILALVLAASLASAWPTPGFNGETAGPGDAARVRVDGRRRRAGGRGRDAGATADD